MEVVSMTPEVADLPVIPAPRKVGCPLEPPAEFADWRAAAFVEQDFGAAVGGF
jgi:hypothetical protein